VRKGKVRHSTGVRFPLANAGPREMSGASQVQPAFQRWTTERNRASKLSLVKSEGFVSSIYIKYRTVLIHQP